MKKYKKVLIIVAHPDDAEISTGMAINRMVQEGSEVYIHCLSLGETKGSADIRKSEAILAGKVLGVKEYSFSEISDRYFYEERKQINSIIFKLVNDLKPDVIFTHYNEDMHPDHIVTSQETRLATSTIRADLYYFKSPYSLNFNPTIIFFGDKKLMDLKLKAISEFKSQTQFNSEVIKKISSCMHYQLLHYSELKELIQNMGSEELYSEYFILVKKVLTSGMF